MSFLTALLLMLLVPQETFERFSYCRNNTRGTYENQCVQFDPSGSGEVRFKRRGSNEVRASIVLSSPGRARLLAVLTGTNFLAGGASYESKRKVADLGSKHLVLELPSGRREAQFNYSELKEVTALVTFFEAILSQETFVFDLDNAIQFERLSVPKRLEQLEQELKSGRVADPLRLIDVLDKIERDTRLLNYARTRAGKLKAEIQKK